MSNTVGHSPSYITGTAVQSNWRRARLNNSNYSGSAGASGPSLAEHIFGMDNFYGESVKSVEHDEYFAQGDDLTPENFQYSLDLENVETLEGNLRTLMRKYERSLECMGRFALAWHFLQQDIQQHSHIKKMFDELQLLRKLSGGNTEGHLDV